MRGFLARTTINVEELMSLQVGDIITTEKSCDADVLMQVEGRNKFVGRIGQFRGNRAIRITRICRHVADEKPEKRG